MALLSVTMYAQDNPNRMIVREKGGSMKGFLVERIDSIEFVKVDGEAKVDVKFLGLDTSDHNNPMLLVSLKRLGACQSYSVSVIPKVRAADITDDITMIQYFQNSNLPVFWQDFEEGILQGFDFDFVPTGEYTILALAYDEFGIPCTGTMVDFTAPEVEIVGNPNVTCEKTEGKHTTELTMRFTPNEDVTKYYLYLCEEGTLESRYEQYASMFGCATMGEFVKFMGQQPYTEGTEFTWENMAPDSPYDIYIQMFDANDNYCDLIKYSVRTDKIGGEGKAAVSIEVGDFYYDDWYGYVQVIRFVPNDQCAVHRDFVIQKSLLDSGEWTEEQVLEYIGNEVNPDYPEDPLWNQYGVDNYNISAEPNTTYRAYSVCQNINGEFGDVAKLDITTPADVPANTVRNRSAVKKGIMQRINRAPRGIRANDGSLIKKVFTIE